MPNSDTPNDENRIRSGLLFVLVAVLLLGLTAGGIYLAKLRSHTLIKQNTPTVATAPPRSPQPESSDEYSRSHPPEKTPPAASTPRPQTQSQSPSTQNQPSPQTPQGAQLPSTGPGDVLGNVIGLISLAYAIGRYLRSRTLLNRSRQLYI